MTQEQAQIITAKLHQFDAFLYRHPGRRAPVHLAGACRAILPSPSPAAPKPSRTRAKCRRRGDAGAVLLSRHTGGALSRVKFVTRRRRRRRERRGAVCKARPI